MAGSSASAQLALFDADSQPVSPTSRQALEPPSQAAAHAPSPERRAKDPDQGDLGGLIQQFLRHLATSRRCSPRTVEAYGYDFRRLAQHLSASGHCCRVTAITTGDLQVFVASLQGLSPASIERLVYALRSLFRYLLRQGIVGSNPAEGVDLPQRSRPLPRALSPGDFCALVSVCETPQERLVIGLLGQCGPRRAELLSLNVQDIAADMSSLRVEGKGRKQRVVPIHASLKPLLASHVASLEAGEPALIRNTLGHRTSPTTLQRWFRRLAGRAGITHTHITLHSLRHFFASELLRLGVDVVTASELLGHTNISTTSIYLHSDPERHRAAVDRLTPLGQQPGGVSPPEEEPQPGRATPGAMPGRGP